jgi:hypothetical protein
MALNLHPMSVDLAKTAMHQFLVDVIDEYRDHEIKDWLQGLSSAQIQAIISRPGHDILKQNTFVIPFTYLQYAVVPPAAILLDLRKWLENHACIDASNDVLSKTKQYFDRIFSGKSSFIYRG